MSQAGQTLQAHHNLKHVSEVMSVADMGDDGHVRLGQRPKNGCKNCCEYLSRQSCSARVLTLS